MLANQAVQCHLFFCQPCPSTHPHLPVHHLPACLHSIPSLLPTSLCQVDKLYALKKKTKEEKEAQLVGRLASPALKALLEEHARCGAWCGGVLVSWGVRATK